MDASLTPERAAKSRDLFDRVVALAPDQWDATLNPACAGDQELRRIIDLLLHIDEHADDLLDRLGARAIRFALLSRWETVRTLFDRILLLEPEERSSLLENICSGDESKRTLLASILAGYEDSPDIFDAPSTDLSPSEIKPAPEKPERKQDKRIGLTVSHYRIVERIGRGGMGVVYKALDTKLDRHVALKFLPSGIGEDEHAEERFIREAKTVSVLDHPNIAVVHEIDRTENDQLFIVMTYYEGETLRDKIARGPLDLVEALDYAIQIGQGLQRAHDEGIIHRDIKPENVVVPRHGPVKIVDFGLAKTQDTNLTKSGMSMGTVAYMSPEQLRGEPVDHRTDLWALGVVLYEMLSGKNPFMLGAVEATALYAIVNQEPEPVRSVRPDVPEQVEWILDRLLQKEPDRRERRADDAVIDLQAMFGLLTGASQASESLLTSTLHAMPRIKADRFARISHVFSGIKKGSGKAITVVLIAVSLWFFDRNLFSLRSPSGDTQQDQLLLEQNRERARELNDTGIDYYTKAQYSLAKASLERALQFDSTYSAAWTSLAAVETRLRNFDAAIANSRHAIRYDSEGTNGTAHYNLAFALEEKGVYDEAIEAYTDAVRIDSTFLQAYSALGYLLIEQDRAREALLILERGTKIVPESEYLFLLFKNMGKAHAALEEYDLAVEFLEKAVELNAEWPESLSLLAQVYETIGQEQKSQDLWQRYLEVESDPLKRQEVMARFSSG